ncbi:MAG TPA: AmmeMemoRadiSam system protein B [Candidatus Dormibacteraeota bacterium]|nr:AmmeMemoRadiSam system protein B [Candidatus Dormibacteraeota bacterium]
MTGDPSSVRRPAVAGSFYPADARLLERTVDQCVATAERVDRERAERLAAGSGAGGATPVGPAPLGILVPHAGLVYSGAVAAAAWRRVAADPPGSVVLLGTNHRASWLDGVGAWDAGCWETPLGPVEVDAELAERIVRLGTPFRTDRAAHLEEHSLEVQLPFLRRLLPSTRVVPLSVAAGTGRGAIEAGRRLGELLADRARTGERLLVAISTDAAHYPSATLAERINERLAPAIEAVDAASVAKVEARIVADGGPGLACGMCGIQPTVLGLSAVRSMGASAGSLVATATSADAGGGWARTVGYLATVFA